MSAHTMPSHARIHHSYAQPPWFVPIHSDKMFLPALLKLSPATALNQKCFLLSIGDLHLLENAWRIFINKKVCGGRTDKAGMPLVHPFFHYLLSMQVC